MIVLDELGAAHQRLILDLIRNPSTHQLGDFLSNSLEKVQGDPPHEVTLSQGPFSITYVASFVCHQQGVVKALVPGSKLVRKQFSF